MAHEKKLQLRRRDILKLLAVSPGLVGAVGASDLQIGQLRTQGRWDVRPQAIRRLLWEVSQRTSIEVRLEPTIVDAKSTNLFRYPLLYWSGSGEHPLPTEEGIQRLRRHLEFGGTMIVDSADVEPKGAFDRSVRALFNKVLPRHEFQRIEPDHVMF